jgi:hypothetical protein
MELNLIKNNNSGNMKHLGFKNNFNFKCNTYMIYFKYICILCIKPFCLIWIGYDSVKIIKNLQEVLSLDMTPYSLHA